MQGRLRNSLVESHIAWSRGFKGSGVSYGISWKPHQGDIWRRNHWPPRRNKLGWQVKNGGARSLDWMCLGHQCRPRLMSAFCSLGGRSKPRCKASCRAECVEQFSLYAQVNRLWMESWLRFPLNLFIIIWSWICLIWEEVNLISYWRGLWTRVWGKNK